MLNNDTASNIVDLNADLRRILRGNWSHLRSLKYLSKKSKTDFNVINEVIFTLNIPVYINHYHISNHIVMKMSTNFRLCQLFHTRKIEFSTGGDIQTRTFKPKDLTCQHPVLTRLFQRITHGIWLGILYYEPHTLRIG